MDRPRIECSGKVKSVGAVPAIERWSVMWWKCFTVLAAICLLLALAVGCEWGRSYYRHDAVRYPAIPDAWAADSNWGQLTICHRTYNGLVPRDADWAFGSGPAQPVVFGLRKWYALGFAYAVFADTARHQFGNPALDDYSFSDHFFTVPFWSLAATALVLPAWWSIIGWKRLVQRQRKALGQCAKCGYDMRFTPGRCPECGTASGRGEPAAT